MRVSRSSRPTPPTPVLAVLVALAVAAPISRPGVSAQSTAQPAFDVASVKLNKSGPGSPQRIGLMSGDRVSFTNVALFAVIATAYEPISELVGGPSWIGKVGQPNWDVDRFDITAKAAAPATREQLQLMLRALLAERFKLAVHTERREEPIWAIVLARRDGRLGPHLRPAQATCAELRAGWQPKEPGEPDPCGTRTFVNALMTGTMSVRGFRLDQLGNLTLEIGRRPVVDKTGLTGTFDWELTWTPQRLLQATNNGGEPRDSGVSLFTALDEQLGLKFESQKGENAVLVIDHIERPSEN
jgi:uncharacterized protein (TIGR03435 family)